MAGSKMFKIFALITFALVAFAGCSDDDPVAPTRTPAPPVPDTAPPAAPTGLVAVDGGFAVNLSWDANVVDGDLAGFHITRTFDGKTTELTYWPVNGTSYADDSAGWGVNVYSVVAVDDSGNRSAAATAKVNVEPVQ